MKDHVYFNVRGIHSYVRELYNLEVDVINHTRVKYYEL
jgi:hypothetical protein